MFCSRALAPPNSAGEKSGSKWVSRDPLSFLPRQKPQSPPKPPTRAGRAGPQGQSWADWEAAAEAESRQRKQAGQNIHDAIVGRRSQQRTGPGSERPGKAPFKSLEGETQSRKEKSESRNAPQDAVAGQPHARRAGAYDEVPAGRPGRRAGAYDEVPTGGPGRRAGAYDEVPTGGPGQYDSDPSQAPLRAALPPLAGVPGVRPFSTLDNNPNLKRPTVVPGMAPPETPRGYQYPGGPSQQGMRVRTQPGAFDGMLLRSRQPLEAMFPEEMDPTAYRDTSWLPDEDTPTVQGPSTGLSARPAPQVTDPSQGQNFVYEPA